MFEQAQRRVLRFVGQSLLVLAALALVLRITLNRPGIICRLDARESAAIATLKNIHSGQQQFAARCAVDLDGDGRGEFGTFVELTGGANLRVAAEFVGPPRRLDPPVLSPAFAAVVAGRVVRNGYCYQIWLATPDGRWIGDGCANGITTHDWCAYAWPIDAEGPRRAFFVDAAGNVLGSANRDHRYCGSESAVPVDAALPSTDAHASGAPEHRTGRDGRSWYGVS